MRMFNQTPRKSNVKADKEFFTTPMKSVKEQLHFFDKTESKYYNSNQKLQKLTSMTDKEKALFNNIDEILNLFTNHFTKHNKDYIMDILRKNSFDLQDSYLQLSHPNEFEGI